MSLIKGLQRRPSLVITTVLACVVVAVVVSQTSRFAATASSEDKQNLQKQLHKGVGSEVRFASRAEQADEAVASASDFIYWRSGLKMSDDMSDTSGTPPVSGSQWNSVPKIVLFDVMCT